MGREAAGRIENELQARAVTALSTAGHEWTRVSTNGMTVTLRGEAPDQTQRDMAIARLDGIMWGASVADSMTIRQRPAPYQPDPSVEILRGISALTIAGAAPGEAAKDALADALNAIAPNLPIADLTRADARGQDWSLITGDAAAAVVALLHGRVVLTPGTLMITGLSAGDDEQSEIEQRLDAVRAAGWTVVSHLAPPPKSDVEPLLHIEAGEDARGIISCTATSPEQAVELSDQLQSLLNLNGTCLSAGTETDDEWGKAAVAAIRSLASIKAGETRLSLATVRLLGSPPTSSQAFAVASAALKTALPQGFSLITLKAAERTDGSSSGTDAPANVLLNVLYDGSTVTLSGDAPSAVLAQSVAAFSRALLPGATVKNTMSIKKNVHASDWRTAAMTMVSAMTTMEFGEGRFDASSALLEGAVKQPGDVSETHELLVKGLGANRKVTTRLAVAMTAQFAAQELPLERCAEEMTAITAKQPITFKTGSTSIGEESGPVIDQLVATISRCADGQIEIGGHTDSQGSEATNLRISRARAEAVLEAMSRSGARLSQMSARGYGEEEPISDNKTEAGRAANRRIEFRALISAEDQGQ